MECPPEDADKPQHWEEYTNFQRTKHELIRLYLSGWFSILGSTHGRIVYFDTHAGRGKYEPGTPDRPWLLFAPCFRTIEGIRSWRTAK